jgi:DNA-directed RNA polymerase subunit RPC12/RpoP
MPQETLGYVRLEWTCPSCSSRNPGPQKTCANCGAPQPENVEFEQAAEEQLITDQAEIARAAAGPDVHCPYCGTRNPAGAKHCKQCGGGLEEGQARATGRVVGAHRSQPAPPVACPACGASNPGTALKCAQCGASIAQAPPQPTAPVASKSKGNKGLLVGCGVAIALALCAFFGIALSGILTPATDAAGRVHTVAWTRTIAIEELAPVEHEGWRDEVPAGASVVSCQKEFHHTQQEPAPNAEKVCGTPYTVDEGSGYGKVVQDCEYRVYADWCRYTVNEWQEVEEVEAGGTDLNPYWPQVRLGAGQQEGRREEVYRVVFVGEDDKEYIYQTSNAAEFGRFQPGSRWALKVKGSTVVSVEPD